MNMGIQQETSDFIPFEELIKYELLESDNPKELKKKQEEFKALINTVHSIIQQEAKVLGDWKESYHWYVDRLVYTFFNRVFAVRILEELELLKESTFVPQPDLGNRSARMAKIQEKFPRKTLEEWYVNLLDDVFQEISNDIKVLFDETDPSLRIWPDDDVIERIIHEINTLDTDIYKAEDCIGWFYHYYVLKFRKGYKTMSSHGQKSPKNPYYLSILNTVYTPRWMVRILLENSLGHWWLKKNPTSSILTDSPYFIKKIPHDIENPVDRLEKLKILDPACGSGNFLIYTLNLLFQMYQEEYPERSCSSIITSILTRNLFGIDINRRPAQLSGLALYIMAKRLLKEHAPSELKSFQMPNVNIICCDIRTPPSKEKTMLLQEIPDHLKKFIKDVDNLFNNADQLGSLIDIRGLKKQYEDIEKEELKKPKQIKLDEFVNKNKKSKKIQINGITSVIDKIITSQQGQDIGLQLFGKQTRNALTLAQVLMKKYDIITTNPPFGLMIDETKDQLKKLYPNSSSDLISAFIDQALRLTRQNGFITMVADFSFLHLPKFEKFRRKILLEKSYIEFLFMIGQGALPDSGNRPVLFIIRDSNHRDEIYGFYRYIDIIDKTRDFEKEIKEDIENINNWTEKEPIPEGWSQIAQQRFLTLPRAVIDLNITEKYKYLLEFFQQYPRLDISQIQKKFRKDLPKQHITRCYTGIQTGKNDIFVRYWFEVKKDHIRKAESFTSLAEVPNEIYCQYIPFSKGGGDIRYYLSNGFILWWSQDSIREMNKLSSGFPNVSLLTKTHLHWSYNSGKPRGRFCISQSKFLRTAASMGIHILDDQIDRFTLLAYLNSYYSVFFVRLQTKKRSWEGGNVARIPIPIDFLKKISKMLSSLSEESYKLRQDWDTGYPMSPIFTESLIDKVIIPNPTIQDPGTPKTRHPFCEEYESCKSEVAINISKIHVSSKTTNVRNLLDAVEERFELLTSRLFVIDESINNILYQLIDEKTQNALKDYYNTFVGETKFYPEQDKWLQDFLMANLIPIVKNSNKGVILLKSQKEDEQGLYEKFIDLLCLKFSRDINSIQPNIKELEELLGKPLLQWIAEDFFFYHCQRFGGRPIVWQFSSRSNLKTDSAIDLFVDYHQINNSTLSLIRVDYVQPIIKSLERRKEMETLSTDEYYKIDEIKVFLKAILELENGYSQIPTPNTLTGKRARPGAGDDKTWEWVFTEAQKIIQNGYKPDHFKGVLVNLVPLCLKIPGSKQYELKKEWKYLCPKGTIKQILKKIDALDQLRER